MTAHLDERLNHTSDRVLVFDDENPHRAVILTQETFGKRVLFGSPFEQGPNFGFAVRTVA